MDASGRHTRLCCASVYNLPLLHDTHINQQQVHLITMYGRPSLDSVGMDPTNNLTAMSQNVLLHTDHPKSTTLYKAWRSWNTCMNLLKTILISKSSLRKENYLFCTLMYRSEAGKCPIPWGPPIICLCNGY